MYDTIAQTVQQKMPVSARLDQMMDPKISQPSCPESCTARPVKLSSST